MPHNDSTGPEGKGRGTGRQLGRCSDLSETEKLQVLGKGLGKKRKADGSQGLGKRLRSAFFITTKKTNNKTE
ncbi:MAG: DUF5320 domain-containing protein [Bacteroidales bacterium]|nr:DUF5320 domain-containing protein [Bacteroidales bacterium]